jgi:predicted PhzF superfamily epimerase YddE/YHI9
MRIFQVDAFADQPFTGNPAAVCLFSGAPDDAWKQDVAREMNLAATAFGAPRPARRGWWSRR